MQFVHICNFETLKLWKLKPWSFDNLKNETWQLWNFGTWNLWMCLFTSQGIPHPSTFRLPPLRQPPHHSESHPCTSTPAPAPEHGFFLVFGISEKACALFIESSASRNIVSMPIGTSNRCHWLSLSLARRSQELRRCFWKTSSRCFLVGVGGAEAGLICSWELLIGARWWECGWWGRKRGWKRNYGRA